MNSQGGNFSFPNINVPVKEKDENWHKNFVWAIANRSINTNYDFDYRVVESCQNYYNGVQDQKAFAFLQQSADGESLPATWINYNKIKTKVDLPLGEFIKKSYRVSVSSVNKEAKVRKLDERETARADFRLSPYTKELEAEFGIPINNGQEFETEDELDDFFSYSYKEKSEIVMKSALDYSLEKQRWSYERRALFRDILINGRCFVKCELINGIPKARRIDPKFMVFDRNVTDDFLTDAAYWGELRYMNFADAAQKYDVTREELTDAYNSYQQALKSRGKGTGRYSSLLNLMNGSTLSFFNEDNGELRVLVLEAYWVDFKRLTNKESEDKYGNMHLKTLSDDTKEGKNIKSNFYKIWRKGVLLGGDIIKDWGEVKNMPRSIDDPSDTGCPYKGVIPNYLNYSSQSIVSLITPLQDLKNIALYNLQLAMTRAGAKGFVYDVAQVPEKWDVHNVMKYLKIAGIAFIDSRQDEGLPSSFNQFQTIDLSLGNEVDKYIAIAAMVDNEMDQITGINEARQGIVQSASQAVGVTQSALLQSSLSTEIYFESFRELSTDIFNYMAGLIKIAWPQYKDRFAPIIGDEGVDFLANDIDLDLNDYDVFIKDVPPSISDTQNLHALIHAALQNQQIDFVDAMKMLIEPDVDRGIRLLDKSLAKKKREMEQQEQQMMKQQQEMMMAQQQSQEKQAQDQMAAEDNKYQREASLKVQLEDMQKSRELSKISSKAKADVILQKMKQDFEKSQPIIKSTGKN